MQLRNLTLVHLSVMCQDCIIMPRYRRVADMKWHCVSLARWSIGQEECISLLPVVQINHDRLLAKAILADGSCFFPLPVVVLADQPPSRGSQRLSRVRGQWRSLDRASTAAPLTIQARLRPPCRCSRPCLRPGVSSGLRRELPGVHCGNSTPRACFGMEACLASSGFLERSAWCHDLASASSALREEVVFCARADGAGVYPAPERRRSGDFRMKLASEGYTGLAVVQRGLRSSTPERAGAARATLLKTAETLSSKSRRRRGNVPGDLRRTSSLKDIVNSSKGVCSCVGVREGPEVACRHGSRDRSFPGFPWLTGPQQVEEPEVEAAPLQTEEDIRLAHYVPVYTMLPLDAVTYDNRVSNPDLMMCNLRALKAAGVDGVMVDLWWGIVEKDGPKKYDWSAYRQLLDMVAGLGLKLQVVMSFHQCGGNTGDSCFIPLPTWVVQLGQECPDIFFKNRDGMTNQEYLSFGVDDECVLHGRTAVQVYSDFMQSFRKNFSDLLKAGVVCEIQVGLGPAGELRYPSYPETHGWKFPGIGEFQCYDKFLLRQLKNAAIESGQHDWGHAGPHDSGRYNDWPHATGFFSGTFASDYGRFFLEWYSSVLLNHGDIILEKAADVFAGYKTKLAAKVAGVHWWYNSHNHAAELAAGYYNLRERDGYRPIAQMLARHDSTLIFTCAEMRNEEQQHVGAQCSPEGLVKQVLHAGWREGLEVACENALPRYDAHAFDQIIRNARPEGMVWDRRPTHRISAFTFLRLGQDLMQEANWAEFVRFVRRMHVGLDWNPEPEQYFRPRRVLRHSKPKQARQEKKMQNQDQGVGSRDVPLASVPLDAASIPPPPSRGSPQGFFSWDAPGGGLSCHVEETEEEICPVEEEEVSGPQRSQVRGESDLGGGGKHQGGSSAVMTAPAEENMMEFRLEGHDMGGSPPSSMLAMALQRPGVDEEGWQRAGAIFIAVIEAWSACFRMVFGSHWV